MESGKSDAPPVVKRKKSMRKNARPVEKFMKDIIDHDSIVRESRVSKKFQEMTTIRVVAIVLVSIMVGPFLNEENDLYMTTSTLADHTIFVLTT